MLATTTQNPQLDTLLDTNTPRNNWTLRTYSFWSTSSTYLTLKFTFQTDNKHEWYLDDVSVKSSTLTEMLTNGPFEDSIPLNGWTTGSSSCSPNSGLSILRSKSSTRSYHHPCFGLGSRSWINQSFVSSSNEPYNISFWFYLDRISGGSGSGSGTVQLDVTMT